MSVFTVLFYCLFAGVITTGSALPAPGSSSYIVGGETTEIQDVPYQAALLYFGMLFCGGSIVTPRAVISAAHCVIGRDPSVVTIRVGSTNNDRGGQEVSLSRAIYHRKFTSKEMDYDVSVLFLSETLNIDNVYIATVAIAPQDFDVPDGALAVASGWGSLQEGGVLVTALRKVTIPIVNHEECERAYIGTSVPVTERMICAGAPGKDACQGDSGGPLAWNGILIGLTSWGLGCARPDFPGVWTRVAAVSTWINDQLKMDTGRQRSFTIFRGQNNVYVDVM